MRGKLFLTSMILGSSMLITNPGYSQKTNNKNFIAQKDKKPTKNKLKDRKYLLIEYLKKGRYDKIREHIYLNGVCKPTFEYKGISGLCLPHIAATMNIKALKFFIEEMGIDTLYTKTYEDILMIHIAAMSGKIENVKYIWEKMGEKNDEDMVDDHNRTPLFYGVEGGLEVVKFLITKTKYLQYTDENGFYVTATAAKFGKIKELEYIYKYALKKINEDLTKKIDYDGRTIVMIAIDNEQFETVKFLVEKIKATLNSIDDRGNNELHHAAKTGNIKMYKYLLKRGVKDNIKNNDEETPKMILKKLGIYDNIYKH